MEHLSALLSWIIPQRLSQWLFTVQKWVNKQTMDRWVVCHPVTNDASPIQQLLGYGVGLGGCITCSWWWFRGVRGVFGEEFHPFWPKLLQGVDQANWPVFSMALPFADHRHPDAGRQPPGTAADHHPATPAQAGEEQVPALQALRADQGHLLSAPHADQGVSDG